MGLELGLERFGLGLKVDLELRLRVRVEVHDNTIQDKTITRQDKRNRSTRQDNHKTMARQGETR